MRGWLEVYLEKCGSRPQRKLRDLGKPYIYLSIYMYRLKVSIYRAIGGWQEVTGACALQSLNGYNFW